MTPPVSGQPHSPAVKQQLALLAQCHFSEIQAAINAAPNGTRILLLPGAYTEATSRKVPLQDPTCAAMHTQSADGTTVPSYDYELHCPNSRNLIALIGDNVGDRHCHVHCDIQIVGSTGNAADVLIEGDRQKLNVIRADRADGVYLANFTIEYSDFNNIYVIETSGFHFNNIVSRYSREYGFLSFVSEAGLYENLNAYGNGDSGVYPGAGPQGQPSERNCTSYGIEIRNVDSHDNNMGYSGTAGDSVWVHDSKFHDNALGMSTDSFAAGHPGSPQHCAKWEHNQIYSNNFNIFTPEHRAYCRQPEAMRDPKVVCSAFQVPVGTGVQIAGGNKDLVQNNNIYDNYRAGIRLFYVPAALRNEPDKGIDTSFDNQFLNNQLGHAPDGARTPNGQDVWWDEQGSGNCWMGNTGSGPNGAVTSDPSTLPSCPGSAIVSPGNPIKQSSQASCAQWDPSQDPPPGCDWAVLPPKPQ